MDLQIAILRGYKSGYRKTNVMYYLNVESKNKYK